MKKLTYLLTVPMVTISCLVFATSLKTEVKKNVPKALAQNTVVKYRQKIKYRIGQELSMAKFKAYQQTDDFKSKSALYTQISGGDVVVKIKDVFIDQHTGKKQGFLASYNNREFEISTFYGQEKQLNNLLNIGDEVTLRAFSGAIMAGKRLSVSPGYVMKNNTKIFQLTEADKISDYPFLYEVNKVRFTDGQVTNIEKYDNGKWKSAVLETVNGYKFNLSFKPTAPDFTGVEPGDHVRLRFVQEVKDGNKAYTINDWVSITENLKDYGFKNPDTFYKFYERI